MKIPTPVVKAFAKAWVEYRHGMMHRSAIHPFEELLEHERFGGLTFAELCEHWLSHAADQIDAAIEEVAHE
jgi:hypothetical protein